MNQHMMDDVKGCPATILTLQEVKAGLFDYLRRPKTPGVPMEGVADSSAGSSTHGNGGLGGDRKWNVRPGSQFWGIRGPEDPTIATTMICAKRSLVKGMRLMLFELRHDGTYVKKTKSQRKKQPSRKDKNCTQSIPCSFLQDEVLDDAS